MRVGRAAVLGHFFCMARGRRGERMNGRTDRCVPTAGSGSVDAPASGQVGRVRPHCRVCGRFVRRPRLQGRQRRYCDRRCRGAARARRRRRGPVLVRCRTCGARLVCERRRRRWCSRRCRDVAALAASAKRRCSECRRSYLHRGREIRWTCGAGCSTARVLRLKRERRASRGPGARAPGA